MKIIKTLIITTFILIGNVTVAQKLTLNDLKQNQLNSQKNIVAQALRYNDMQTAINSIHHIIATEGANSTYKDTLVIAYYSAGRYVSSHLLAKELLQTKPSNTELLEINAISLQQLGDTKQAITAYESLFRLTNNMAHGYQLAQLQFNIQRFAEAKTTIAQTLNCAPVENAYIALPVDKTKNQKVVLKAAVYNLQGLIHFNLNDKATAVSAFKKALEIMPEFALAKQNNNALVLESKK
ncbi:MAG: tetratricopeptide repeat protein [Kordia sp.]|uniref:tetratricopeptide repeat protein n=1 Tax=Kordia sp. TaxID=1965332 RepID=UPI00385DC90F